MASIIVLVIIAACAALMALKAGIYKATLALVSALLASVIAFAYSEPLAASLISKEKMVDWAQTVCFLLIFAASFAVLIGIALAITRWKVEFEAGAEKAGGAVVGILLGIVISGVLLTALVLAPLKPGTPYARFDERSRNFDDPGKALLNPDGLVTGLFSAASSGSLSGRTSFALARADFLDQAYLTRMGVSAKIKPAGTADAIRVPSNNAAWPVLTDLVNEAGDPVNPDSGCELVFIRIGFSTANIVDNGNFLLAQLRAICKKPDLGDPLVGKGHVAYPIGYMAAKQIVAVRGPTEKIVILRADIMDKDRYVDFVFNVPAGTRPVLVEFKRMAIAQVSFVRSQDQTPEITPFVPEFACSKTDAELYPSKTARLYGVSISTADKLLSDLQLAATDANEWQRYQTPQATLPAQFRGAKLACVSASLKVPLQDEQGRDKGILGKILDVPDGYKLVSLGCNIISPGSQVTASQYPELMDLNGDAHKPVGAIAVGSGADASLYQVDYCPARATLSEAGVVTNAFPPSITIPADASKTEALYFVYMVKAGNRIIISSVKPAAVETAAGFKTSEGLFVN